MNQQTASRKRAWWLRRERIARRAWQRSTKRYDESHPKRIEAWERYRRCQSRRVEYDDLIAKLNYAASTRRPVGRMSEKGIEFLAREEGQRNYAYNDSAGHATFGIGHLIHKGPVNDTDRRRWGTPYAPMSDEMVYQVFRTDLAKYEAVVRAVWSKAPFRPTQPQFDACVSLCFNIGVGAFTGSTCARLIRSGSTISKIGDAMLLWNKPPELVPRRKRERRLFTTARYR